MVQIAHLETDMLLLGSVAADISDTAVPAASNSNSRVPTSTSDKSQNLKPVKSNENPAASGSKSRRCSTTARHSALNTLIEGKPFFT